MIRNTDLIEETVELANTVIDLLRKVASVHHLVQAVSAVAEGGGRQSGNNAMYVQAIEGGRTLAWRRMRKNVCRVYLEDSVGVNRGLGKIQSGSLVRLFTFSPRRSSSSEVVEA